VVQSWSTRSRQPTALGFNNSFIGTMTITHPFHPDYGKQFDVISVQHCWGEPRIRYRRENGESWAVAISWTSLRPPDIFLEVSAGRSIVHPKDLRSLQQLVRSLGGPQRAEEEPRNDAMGV
jgi:hypothetical protein